MNDTDIQHMKALRDSALDGFAGEARDVLRLAEEGPRVDDVRDISLVSRLAYYVLAELAVRAALACGTAEPAAAETPKCGSWSDAMAQSAIVTLALGKPLRGETYRAVVRHISSGCARCCVRWAGVWERVLSAPGIRFKEDGNQNRRALMLRNDPEALLEEVPEE